MSGGGLIQLYSGVAYFDRVTFPGHGFCLPRIPFVLIAKSGFDGASPTRVAFVDARDEPLASLRFSRQGLLEHLYDVARRQQLQARLLGHALSTMNSIANITIVTW